MKDHHKNYGFFRNASAAVRDSIVKNICDNYGITREEMSAEIFGEGAHHLLEYLTDPVRSTVRLLMKIEGFA